MYLFIVTHGVNSGYVISNFALYFSMTDLAPTYFGFFLFYIQLHLI